MKKEIKRLWGIFLILTLLLTTIGPVRVSSAEIWASGKCGDNITWSIYSDGVFKLEGTGEMYDYAYDRVPWRSYNNQIQKVEVSEGITYIGTCAFHWCHCIEEISLPSTLKKIGDEAFFMAEIFTEIDIPESVEEIGAYAFYDSSLEKFTLSENIKTFGTWPVSSDCQEVIVETSKNITIYEMGFAKEGEEISKQIAVNKVRTSVPVTVTNESGRDIYVDGLLVPTGTSVLSTVVEVTTETNPDETTTEEVTTQYGEKTGWEFDKETGTLTVYGSSTGSVDYLPEGDLTNKVRHIILAQGVSSVYDTALYPNVEDVYISASVVNVYDMDFVANSRNLKEINVSEDNHYYTSIDGNLYSGKNNISLTLDRYAPGKTDETFVLPTKAKSIDEDAFDYARYLKEVTLHKGVFAVSLPLSSYITRVNIMNPDCTIIEDSNKSNLVVSAFKNSTVEKYCSEYEITFEEMPIPKAVKYIAVSSGPDKSLFKKDTKAILGKVRIKVTYEDDTTQYMSSGYSITGVDTSTAGTKTVTVTFGDKTCNFDVEVVEIEEDEYININEPKLLPLNTVVDTKEIFFIALVDGLYTIYSTGEYDTYATIYTMNYGRLSYNDDSGDGGNFLINRQLTAGRTYIIEVTFFRTTTYSSDFALPEINVTLKELTGNCSHNYELEKVVAPTCTSQGYSKNVCSICGDIQKDNYVDKEEHYYEVMKVVEPTCEKEGYIIHRCNDCGYRTGMADKDNLALGHVYTDIVIKPTNTEYGYTLHECEICENTYKSDWTDPLSFDVNPKDEETTTKIIIEEQTIEELTTEEQTTTTSVNHKISKPKVKAKRIKSKIKLTLSCKTKKVKYQIYIKKNGKYKLVKTTAKKVYKFKNKKKCYIKVRCVKTINKVKIYSKFRKIKVK